ncbi:MAG: T9SS type A sorting domain-containing protein [Ignavibacteriales bacterium]|nr:T9SS type A sorting domain-containing protein [Ignavibacteriales bacterium]
MKKILLIICFTLITNSWLFAQFLSGTYYVGVAGTRPGGGDPEYLTLFAACTALNTNIIIGDCTFLICSDIPEPANVGLGLNTNGFTITFKPAEGIQPTITFTKTTDNAGRTGNLVIGCPNLAVTSANNYGMVKTENIVIDGSNIVGGTSRDLTFLSPSTSFSGAHTITLMGDVNHCIIKNCIVRTLGATGSSIYGVTFVNRYGGTPAVFSTPDSILVDNCDILCNNGNAAQAFSITNSFSGSPTWTSFSQGCVIRNCKITGRTRGIMINTGGNTDIYNNEILVNQTTTGFSSSAVLSLTIDPSAVINIYNNKFSLLSTGNKDAGDYGINAINVSSGGTYNIYNNMIYGFATTTVAANPNCQLYGIRTESAAATVNAYFNSILLPEIAIIRGTGVLGYRGIYVSNGTVALKNNIIFSQEATDSVYGVYRRGVAGTLVSDYNDFGTSSATGYAGYWQNAPTPLLSDWTTASQLDSHSISVDPQFVSTTDLHLAVNTSLVMGKGTPISTITKDIDGQDRDTPPELGADEIPGLVPVELVAFNAQFSNSIVTLNWKTATETNNQGFQVERKANGNWEKVGYVKGAGTSSNINQYSYVDNNVPQVEKVSYRLKQIDLNGSYNYSSEVEVATQQPNKFELSQNYPNPFNPTTKINYTIPVDSKVTLAVYSITGELVIELVNELQTAGTYTVDFNASNLANGTYFYKISAGNFIQAKKMMLVK